VKPTTDESPNPTADGSLLDATDESPIVAIDVSPTAVESLITGTESARDVGDAARGVSLWRAVDELAVAVDRLFVTELQRGLADEETVELIATALDLAAVARVARFEGAVPREGAARANDAEVTCSD
jgi:hypothetical protein